METITPTQEKIRRTRAVGIILKDDKLLVIWRRRGNRHYYVFPGGGLEKGETLEEAVVRELQEEATIEVKPRQLLYYHYYIGETDAYFYLCDYIKGEPHLAGDGPERQRMLKNPDNEYRPMWIEVSKLPHTLLWPLEIRDWLIEDIRSGFKNCPRQAEFIKSEMRQRF